ncbi:hypothetical protein IGI04_002668, partial [Brassica rapa subsp. trilocularis]
RVLGFRSVATEIVAFPIIGSLCGGEACLDGKASGVGFLGLHCKGNPIFRSVLGFHFFIGLEARVGDSFNQTQAEIPVSREASGLGSARGDVYAQASLAGKASPSLTFLPHVVVRRLGFPSTDIAKLSGVDTNQLEQRCGKAKITKMLSRASSKVPAPFGNATLGQAPASGSASFLYC